MDCKENKVTVEEINFGTGRISVCYDPDLGPLSQVFHR